MVTRRRGRTIALASGLCVLVVGLVVVAGYDEEIHASYVLWKHFERLASNKRGCPEYRHRTTGMVFVKLPGGEVFVPTYDPPKVEIRPFLIATRTVEQADWENALGQYPVWIETGLPGNRRLETVSLKSCQEFCTATDLTLPNDAQLEHARDLLAIPEDSSDLKPVQEIWSGGAAVQRSVPAGFCPVFNLFAPEQDIADQQSRGGDRATPSRIMILGPPGTTILQPPAVNVNQRSTSSAG